MFRIKNLISKAIALFIVFATVMAGAGVYTEAQATTFDVLGLGEVSTNINDGTTSIPIYGPIWFEIYEDGLSYENQTVQIGILSIYPGMDTYSVVLYDGYSSYQTFIDIMDYKAHFDAAFNSYSSIYIEDIVIGPTSLDDYPYPTVEGSTSLEDYPKTVDVNTPTDLSGETYSNGYGQLPTVSGVTDLRGL